MKKCILFLFLFNVTIFSQIPEEFRAVKLTDIDSQVLFTDENIAAAMDYLASINVNVVLPVVWNGGYTQYPSSVMDSLFSKRIDPGFAGRDPLERVIIEAHRVGIEVYPWFEYGFAAWYSGGSPPYGGHILQKFPHWALRNSNGQITVKNGFDWMSAINPEVQDLIKKLTLEVIDKYDVDGVEYSDRIPALPVEGGYDSVTADIYKKEHKGAAPPADYRNSAWMQWRADKLNGWYKDMRNSVKERDSNLFVSSSPSLYPWSYQEYLQDGKSWIEQDIIDQFIPQLYRYDFSGYLYELNNAVNLMKSGKRNILYAGILMNIGKGTNAYLMTPEYLLQSLEANRARNVKGEAFFYYEGLRKQNNLLGDTLKATYYKDYAIVPGRNGIVRRPPAALRNEEDGVITGSWEEYSMPGFRGLIKRTGNKTQFESIDYYFDVSTSAYYDVFIYCTPNLPWTDSACYSIYSDDKVSEIIYDQSNLKKKGWQKLSAVFLSEGEKKVLSVDNRYLESGKFLTADAVMLLINRRLSPEAVVPVQVNENENNITPADFTLYQNFPNPFNPSTIIEFSVPGSENNSVNTELAVYDLLGRRVAELVNGRISSGRHSVEFNAGALGSGIYFYRLSAGSYTQTRKMLLLR